MDARFTPPTEPDPEPVVAIGGTRYHVGRTTRADGMVYDVSSDEGALLARLSRANDVDQPTWTVERWSDELDTRTAQDIVRVAIERPLVSGHTGFVRGTLLSVEKGYASIELSAGSEVWVPCGTFTNELHARARLAKGERAVEVELCDGVPVGFKEHKVSVVPPSNVVRRGSLEIPTLRMRRHG